MAPHISGDKSVLPLWTSRNGEGEGCKGWLERGVVHVGRQGALGIEDADGIHREGEVRALCTRGWQRARLQTARTTANTYVLYSARESYR